MLDEKQIREVLGHVQDPELNRDIVSLGMVRQVRVQARTVSITLALTKEVEQCLLLAGAPVGGLARVEDRVRGVWAAEPRRGPAVIASVRAAGTAKPTSEERHVT